MRAIAVAVFVVLLEPFLPVPPILPLPPGGSAVELRLALDTELQHHSDPQLLGGVDVVTGPGVVAIPYFSRNNRGKGEMAVWLRY